MKLPQLLHSTRSYGQANSAFSWKLLVRERGSLSYRPKSWRDRSAKDAWFGYSPVGALKKLLFISYSRLAEDWRQRSGSSSTISPTTLFFAISTRGQHNYAQLNPPRLARIRDNTDIHAASDAALSGVNAFLDYLQKNDPQPVIDV
jgi:hypothetical protein